MAVASPDREQLAEVVALARDVLGPDLVGAYLHGSATLGGLRPRSDLDVLVVSGRQLDRVQKERLVAGLLTVSGDASPRPPRPVELTVVVQADVRPWRYPPRRDFQYGEWLRRDFASGAREPWLATPDPDLAILLTMVLSADHALAGPPPAAVLEPVPRADRVSALADAVSAVQPGIDAREDVRNGLLTLARIWCTAVTGEIRSKDAAADWAVRRLPSEHRAVLARARSIYLGNEDERWDDLEEAVRGHVGQVVREIEQALGR